MPELPEVETIRRVLEPQLRGRRILRAELLTPGWRHTLPRRISAAPPADRHSVP